jgi:glycosyltransferase involved in cell wall biosynthesis
VHNGRFGQLGAGPLSRVGEGQGEGPPSPELSDPHSSPLPSGRGSAAVLPEPHEQAVFTAGRLWDEGKNIALLDRAAARLAVPVRAAGSTHGPNGATIHLSHIEHLGSLTPDAMAAQFAARPIFCSPARYEPFGLAILEAAAAGCALVLSDIPTFRELWQDAAIFVSADDDAALTRALQELVDDPARRGHLGAAARKRAGRYGVATMVEGTLAVYGSLLASAGSPWPGQPHERVEQSAMNDHLQGVSR